MCVVVVVGSCSILTLVYLIPSGLLPCSYLSCQTQQFNLLLLYYQGPYISPDHMTSGQSAFQPTVAESHLAGELCR